jgi:hypothetical protein
MEYADNIYPNDDNFYRFVGYSHKENNCITEYFSQKTVDIIKNKVTELTLGVDPYNRPYVVADKVIYHVMSQIYDSFRPATGGIYTRYIMPSGTTSLSYVNNMINQVIEVITMDIKTTTGIEENNKKLTVWTTLYGDFNEHKLKQHSKIKVQNKRPAPFQFNMNY